MSSPNTSTAHQFRSGRSTQVAGPGRHRRVVTDGRARRFHREHRPATRSDRSTHL